MSENLIELIERRLKLDLPGHQNQGEMVQGRRVTPDDARRQELKPRESAVLLALYPDQDEWKTIFILRNTYKGVHSNQVSLPGGKKEDSDNSLIHTALRETNEEIGIVQDHIRILGALSELYIPPSNFVVQPYIGVIDYKPIFIPDPREVNEIIISPVNRILEDNVMGEKELYLERYKRSLRVSYFDINGHVVWGATAIILKEFRDLILNQTI